MQHLKRNLLVLLSLALMASPTFAQGDPWASATGFFTDLETFLISIAVIAATIGFLGLAIMYLGSSFPLVSDWKQENPKAARNVVIGLIILIFVGGGGMAGMLSF